MTDIVLVPITGAANLSAINNNFAKVQESVNNDVLNLAGGNNTMNQDIDMNGNDLLNLNTDVDNPSGLITLGQADARYYNVSGDTLTGGMNAAGQHIINLPVPSVGTEPMRKAEFDASVVAQDVRDDSQDALAAATKNQTVRAPDGETIPALPIAAGRADKLMSFDSFGNPVAIAAANQSATDLELRLADYTNPAKGAGLVGWKRDLYAAATATTSRVQRQLSTTPVSIFEKVDLVVTRPNPADFSTWDWRPALVAALATGDVVDISHGTFGFDGDVSCPSGSSIVGNGRLLFRTGTLLYSGVTNFSLTGVRVDSVVGAAIRIATCTDFNLHRVRSDGSNKQCGLITASSNFTITECDVKNVGMTGTIVPSSEGNAFYIQGSNDFTIARNDLSRTRGFGAIFLYQCYDCVIADNDIYDTWYRAIDAEGTSAIVGPLKCVIINNRIKRSGSISTDASAVGRNGIFLTGVGTGGRQLDDYVVCYNSIVDSGENGLEGHGTFMYNIIDGTGVYGGTSPSLEGIFASTTSVVAHNTIYRSFTSGIKLPGESSGDIWVMYNNIYYPGTNGIDSNYTLGGTVRVHNFVIKDNRVDVQVSNGIRPYFIFDSSGTRSFNGSCEFSGNTSNVERLQSLVHAGLAQTGTAAPTLGGWKHGMTRSNSVITTGQPIDWRCIRSGQFTAVAFDATSAGNTNILTAVTNISTLRTGDIIKSAGGITPYEIIAVNTAASTITIIPNFGSAGTFTFSEINPLFATIGTMP